MVYNSDYSWLPNSVLKGVTLPKIVYEEPNNQYGGYYSSKDSIICVVVSEEALIPATIAHELRHHSQFTYGKSIKVVKMNQSISYEEAIAEYFKSSWSEMDALRFEHKYAKTWLNDWWYRKLVGIV